MSAGLSPQCASSNHKLCPGYYMTAELCQCGCHKKQQVAQQVAEAIGPQPPACLTDPDNPAELLAKLHRDTRVPPPGLVQQVNKGGFVADAVGHADTTDLLLSHDPCWSWEPFALDDKGNPLVMYDASGRARAMWIRLTVHGHTRIGIGTCSPTASDPYKELIGDAIRNAAMRFGVALSLWSKSEAFQSPEDPKSRGETGQNRQRPGTGK